MNQINQVNFKRLISLYYQQYKDVLNITNPTFEEHGFLTTAKMVGSGGHIEILCGPAEYHAEILVFTFEDQKRWNLAELMSIERVRNWLVSYSQKANKHAKTSLEADIEWLFLLLANCLKSIPQFNWLHRLV